MDQWILLVSCFISFNMLVYYVFQFYLAVSHSIGTMFLPSVFSLIRWHSAMQLSSSSKNSDNLRCNWDATSRQASILKHIKCKCVIMNPWLVLLAPLAKPSGQSKIYSCMNGSIHALQFCKSTCVDTTSQGCRIGMRSFCFEMDTTIFFSSRNKIKSGVSSLPISENYSKKNYILCFAFATVFRKYSNHHI